MVEIRIGQRFGVLVVECRVSRFRQWFCRCDCGRGRVAREIDLRRGSLRSCGNHEPRHGQTKHPLFSVWQAMIARCESETHGDYDQYGGRGIRVCEAWRNSFVQFLKDVGERPEGKRRDGKSAYSLERIGNDGNYEPGNVKWATALEQSNNQRSTRRITYAGETMSLSAWARKLKVNRSMLFHRLAAGESVSEAFAGASHRGKRRSRFA